MKCINKLTVIFFLFMMTGCSSITNLDISSIIDKTENWLFEDEENNEENDNEENNQEEFIENKTEEVEEVFPDIAEIPQIAPDFEQIDEEFFEKNDKEINNEEVTKDEEFFENKEISETREVISSLEKNNISAVLQIRENIRFKLTRLLLESDPPVDNEQPLIKESLEKDNATKVAIIQFPDNSIIPDDSAESVIMEIVKFKDTKKIKLIGHASRKGSETIVGKRKNMEISISRANTIKNMLINKGFEGDKIMVVGKGDLEPLKDEEKKFGEAVNRRVEIFFISN